VAPWVVGMSEGRVTVRFESKRPGDGAPNVCVRRTAPALGPQTDVERGRTRGASHQGAQKVPATKTG